MKRDFKCDNFAANEVAQTGKLCISSPNQPILGADGQDTGRRTGSSADRFSGLLKMKLSAEKVHPLSQH